MLADALAQAWSLGAFRRAGPSRAARGTVEDTPVLVVKPQTYMNRSGAALRPLLDEPDFDPARHLLILTDDAAIPLGTLRLRARGSHGGHRGLESVETALGSREYCRLRIGVGPQPSGLLMEDYVLEEFSSAELDEIQTLMPTLCDAVTCWITQGIEEAMNRFNRRPDQTDEAG